MSLTSMLTRKDPLKRAFVTLEDGMTDILKEEFLLPPEISDPHYSDPVIEGYAAAAREVDELTVEGTELTVHDAPVDRISPHTQDRLARYSGADDAQIRTTDELNRMSEALANLVASNRTSREMLNDYYADIHRANEFENANAAYAAENRRLTERVDKLERLRARYDQLVDVLKRREVKLLAEAEELRESVATSKLELVEAQTAIARSDSLNGELRAALSSRTSEAERFMRNAELLREKNVGLTLDLELSNKKQAESRRKADELAAMHASDTARLAELMARLSAEEGEAARLQKLADSVEAKLVDANENTARLAADLIEREKRYQSENSALKAEMQTLHARLQGAASEQRDALSDAAGLRSRIGDLESDKQIMDQKIADLRGELETERHQKVGLAQPASDDESASARQADQMRREIAELRATVERQSRSEARMRGQTKADVATGFKLESGKLVPEFGRANTAARTA